MVDLLLLIPVILSFLMVLAMMPTWIKRIKEVGLCGKDMHKNCDEKVAESGGICVIAGFVLGVLVYIAMKTFYFKTSSNIIEIFALLCTILIVGFIGMIDDICGWKIGLSKKARLFWVLIAAIPLMVINAGNASSLSLYLNNSGWIYPLIIIPLGIIGASTTFNFLAGYNGLEAGMGILIISALSAVSFITGNTWLALVGLCMVASLLGFFIFNKYPAKVFPGDTLTYSVGALIAGMAILGDYEKFALFIFIPYFIEIILKVRGKLKKESFALAKEDGTIDLRYEKFYGIEHIALYLIKKLKPSKKVYEYEVVFLIWAFELMFILAGFFIFANHLF